ncbi:MAG TPA: hypothetical protein VIP29_04095 [Nitrososphaeraceae archaeon]|nr:hypothetical protein [Nitrososphaeraceae archaeon]
MQTGRSRPLGVTIVAILMIIEGIFLIFGGIAGVAVGGIIAEELGIAIIAASSVGLALGIAGLFIAWGLITGKGWAWIITIIITIIMAIVNIISIASGRYEHIFGLIINGVILYYMYRPQVKGYFGRTSIST